MSGWRMAWAMYSLTFMEIFSRKYSRHCSAVSCGSVPTMDNKYLPRVRYNGSHCTIGADRQNQIVCMVIYARLLLVPHLWFSANARFTK